MLISAFSRVFPAVLLLAAAPAALALPQGAPAPATLPFPLAVRADLGAGGLKLAATPELLERLAALDRVSLAGVALPGGRTVGLQLERVAIATDDAVLRVDGVVRKDIALDAGVSLWTGHVAGEPGSDVFLAFSTSGSRGWVRSAGTLVHLIAEPDADGGWTTGAARLLDEQALRAAGAVPPAACQALSVAQPFAGPLPRLAATLSPADSAPLPVLEARVALETDFQYYELFGNLDAARTYALSLFGAVSSRYREQIGVVITLPYLGLYTTAADPWVSQDIGGGSIDVLYEFRDAWGPGWGGTPPVSAVIHHLMSGASLGGGVAYLDVLCNEDYGFGVSGNIGGNTPLPPVPFGALNWDFVVTAHEMGHNFNAVHTHDYCPPVDECAPDGYFGFCQDEQVCIPTGSIMSYCHLCDGGFLNETTVFAPESVADMRAAALASCMPLFKGILSTNLGFAKSGSNGTPKLEASFTATPDTLTLDITKAPKGKIGSLFLSLTQALLPFKGGTLVPAPDLILGLTSSTTGTVNLPLLVPFTFPAGLSLYAQAWFKDNGPFGPNIAATNGLLVEIIIP